MHTKRTKLECCMVYQLIAILIKTNLTQFQSIHQKQTADSLMNHSTWECSSSELNPFIYFRNKILKVPTSYFTEGSSSSVPISWERNFNEETNSNGNMQFDAWTDKSLSSNWSRRFVWISSYSPLTLAGKFSTDIHSFYLNWMKGPPSWTSSRMIPWGEPYSSLYLMDSPGGKIIDHWWERKNPFILNEWTDFWTWKKYCSFQATQRRDKNNHEYISC
jgi:hypothetical protein